MKLTDNYVTFALILKALCLIARSVLKTLVNTYTHTYIYIVVHK